MKIKNIKQLKAERKQLSQRCAELEKAIRYDWRDLKESFRPENIASQVLEEKQNGKTFIAESLSQIASRFTSNMVDKAETKIKKWMKK